jgi:hypothetical protein
LNWKTIDNAKLSRGDVMKFARDVIVGTPQVHAARVYTRDELMTAPGSEMITRAAVNGFNQMRSGDVIVVQEPYYLFGSTGTSQFHPVGIRHARACDFLRRGCEAGNSHA